MITEIQKLEFVEMVIKMIGKEILEAKKILEKKKIRDQDDGFSAILHNMWIWEGEMEASRIILRDLIEKWKQRTKKI